MRNLFAAALAATLIALPLLPATAAVATGEDAPAFTVKDTEGKDHSLSDYEGKFVVLEWVNFGCPFVKKHYDSSKNEKWTQKN